MPQPRVHRHIRVVIEDTSAVLGRRGTLLQFRSKRTRRKVDAGLSSGTCGIQVLPRCFAARDEEEVVPEQAPGIREGEDGVQEHSDATRSCVRPDKLEPKEMLFVCRIGRRAREC